MRKLLLFIIFPILFSGNILCQNEYWETDKTDMPIHKWSHMACVVDGKIFVIGGYVPVDDQTLNSVGSSEIQVYDPIADTWDISRAHMPTARAYGAIAEINGKVYVAGGATTVYSTQVDILEIYDPITDTWTTGTPMSTPRYECRGAVLNNKFYVIGGFGGSKKEIEEYNPDNNRWRTLPNMPEETASMTVDTLGGKIIVTGGIPSSGNPIKTIQTFNPEMNSWAVEQEELPYEVSHQGSVSVPGKVILCGGDGIKLNLTTWELFGDVFMYDPLNESVIIIDELPTFRSGMTCNLIGDDLYVVGGYNPTTEYEDYSEFFRPVVEVLHLPHYAYNTVINRTFLSYTDSLLIKSQMFNHGPAIKIMAIIEGLDVFFSDSIEIYDDGYHYDFIANDGIYGNTFLSNLPEGFFQMDIVSLKNSSGVSFTTSQAARFTTVGPVQFNTINYTTDTIPDPGDEITIKPVLINKGSNAVAGNIMAEISSLDTARATLSANGFSFGHIPPGEMKESSTRLRKIMISENCLDSTILSFSVDISSNDFVYWRDTLQIKVGYDFVSGMDDLVIKDEGEINIFPNPTSGIINITGLNKPANIKIYNLQGQLLKSFQQGQNTINISDLQPGVYILSLQTGDKRMVKKVVRE